MQKKSQRKNLRKELDRLASKYIKLRDKNTCQWCGKMLDNPHAMHCSHVIPRSAGDRYRWMPENIKVLCFHCHISKWHKDPLAAKKWFKGKFPERFKVLERERKKGLKKFTIIELERLKDEYLWMVENWDTK